MHRVNIGQRLIWPDMLQRLNKSEGEPTSQKWQNRATSRLWHPDVED